MHIFTTTGACVFFYFLTLKQKWHHVTSQEQNLSILVAFFDISGVVHHELIPQSQPVNTKNYYEVLRRQKETIPSKWPEMWHDGNWAL